MAIQKTTIQKGTTTYKLVVPFKLESKIRLLLNRIANIEWSGVLFYRYEGSFENKDLKIICEDLLPLNIGNSVYTEFEMGPEVASFMVEHDLLDCQQGLIHSHHNMATFFSGTDVATLESEGSERNNFVSLIVNNEGTYSAAITCKEHREITRERKITFPFFGEATPITYTVRDTVVEDAVTYYMLDVTIEKSPEFDELNACIDELKKKTFQTPKFPMQGTFDFLNTKADKEPIKSPKEPATIDKVITITKEDLDTQDFDPDFLEIPRDVIEAVTAQIITGNITARRLPENNENLVRTCDQRYASRCTTDGELAVVIETAVDLAMETNVLHFMEELDAFDKFDPLARAVIAELEKYKELLPNTYDELVRKLESYTFITDKDEQQFEPAQPF